MNLTIRHAALNTTGNTTFEAEVTGAGPIVMPSATVIPERAEGAVRKDGTLSWLRLSGPVNGSHPSWWASWAWDATSPDAQRDLTRATEPVMALAERLLAELQKETVR